VEDDGPAELVRPGRERVARKIGPGRAAHANLGNWLAVRRWENAWPSGSPENCALGMGRSLDLMPGERIISARIRILADTPEWIRGGVFSRTAWSLARLVCVTAQCAHKLERRASVIVYAQHDAAARERCEELREDRERDEGNANHEGFPIERRAPISSCTR
jgi:hypothetical protein